MQIWNAFSPGCTLAACIGIVTLVEASRKLLPHHHKLQCWGSSSCNAVVSITICNTACKVAAQLAWQ